MYTALSHLDVEDGVGTDTTSLAYQVQDFVLHFLPLQGKEANHENSSYLLTAHDLI